jgi:cytochrome c oxidase assembly protein subunit 15
MAFLLLLAGGLVTSNNAGLSVPDWPTTQGSLWKVPPMVGGVKYEHGHRMIAEFVGLMTIIVAIWTWIVDKRRWMRALTIGAVLGVIFQGVLGGLTVLKLLPPAISTAHAAVGQTMFCVLAAIAVFTSQSWMAEPTETLPSEDSRPLIRQTWMLIGFLYLQLVLGAAFRHVWTKLGPTGANTWPTQKIIHMFLYPHILNALIVAGLIVYVGLRVLTRHRNIPQLRIPGHALTILLVLQVILGFAAYVTRVVYGVNEVQPTFALIATTVAHIGIGALILASAVILAIQAHRHASDAVPYLVSRGNREVARA